MYKRFENKWKDQIICMLIDAVVWQIALIVGYMLRFGWKLAYSEEYYLRIALLLFIIQTCVAFFSESYRNILKRGKVSEVFAVLRHVALTIAFLLFYLYLTKQNEPMSRLFFGYFVSLSLVLMWCGRTVYKWAAHQNIRKNPNRMYAVLAYANENRAEKTVENLKKAGLRVIGVCYSDRNGTGEETAGVPVVADSTSLADYIKANVVDGVFISLNREESFPSSLADLCLKMGVSTHTNLTDEEALAGESLVDTIGDYTVLTRCVRSITAPQLFIKRAFDILAGLAGMVVTGICFLFVAPAIYSKSPGPIFFSQTRVGKNGRKFKIYKFRSMYMDAEERKKELMRQNKIKDGMMFKMDDDPRIIKGVGHFIRDWSIDELPQMWNVLKGDMSLIGTRPPTVEEYEKYDYHHKMRLSIKPGITGMWQTSGRSNITDFEQVVALDCEYITHWSFALDFKILLKTVKVVLKKDGAA